MHRKIDLYENMNEIMKQLKKGILLTTKKDGQVNTMTIAWGAIGIEWNKTVFMALVRQSRHTHDMMEGEFTVNIPVDDSAKKALSYCGTKSGRDTDKIADMGLTLVEGQEVDVPAIKELPMTLECRIIYEQKQDENLIPDSIKKSMYPNSDFHTVFFGEIVAAYVIE